MPRISEFPRVVLATVLACVFACSARPAIAQSRIGSAIAITNIVQGLRGDTTRPLTVGASVFSDDRVKTGNDSLGQFLFVDQTKFTIGANSDAVLRLVYHPREGISDLIMRDVIGAFRYVSGIQTSLQKRLEFPFGYITVRGTIVDLLVWHDRAVIILEEGATTVVPYATRRHYNLDTPGTYLTVYANGRVVGPRPLNVLNINGQVPSYPWQTQLLAFNPDENLNDIVAGLNNAPPVDPMAFAYATLPVGLDLLTGGFAKDGFTQSGSLLPFAPYGPSTHLLTSQSPSPNSFSVSASNSFTGGAFIGYHKQFGQVVVGVEGDFAWKKFSASNSATVITTATYGPACFGAFCLPAGPFPAQRTESFFGQVGQDWDASVRLRLGTLISPTTLLYLTGGPALGHITGAFSYSGTMNNCGNGIPPSGTCSTPADLAFLLFTQSTTGAASWGETRLGFTVGSGFETEVTPRWKLRLEYRYTDFGTFSHDVPLTERCTDIAGGAYCNGTTGIGGFVPIVNASPPFAHIVQQASFQTIRFGVSYSFGDFDVGGFTGNSRD